MNKKKLIILVGAGVVLVIGILVGIFFLKVYANPFNRTMIAIGKSMNYKSCDTTTTMHFTLDPQKYGDVFWMEDTSSLELVSKLLEKTTLEENIVQQRNKKNIFKSKTQITANVLYDDEKLVDAIMVLNNEEIKLLAPSIMDKTFYVTLDDLFNEMDIDYEDLNVNKYYNLILDHKKLFKSIDLKSYEELVKDNFEDEIKKGHSVKVQLAGGEEVKCREYTIKIDSSDFIDLAKDLQEEIADDDDFREFIRVVAVDILNEMYDSKDYKMINIAKEDIKDAIDMVEDDDDFEDVYEEAMVSLSEAIDDSESSMEESNMDGDYEITYAIDRFNHIRSTRTSMDLGYVKYDVQAVVNTINKKVLLIDDQENERIELLDTIDMDDQDINELLKDILVDSGNKIAQNKALDNLLRDVQKESINLGDQERQELNDWIENFLKDKEGMINNILEGLE